MEHRLDDWLDQQDRDHKEANEPFVPPMPPSLTIEEIEAAMEARVAPRVIWLQWEGDEVTWCEDKINDSDVRYIAAPLIEDA